MFGRRASGAAQPGTSSTAKHPIAQRRACRKRIDRCMGFPFEAISLRFVRQQTNKSRRLWLSRFGRALGRIQLRQTEIEVERAEKLVESGIVLIDLRPAVADDGGDQAVLRIARGHRRERSAVTERSRR